MEILVHVCAPTTTAHDGFYRRVAHAYLGFDAGRRIAVCGAMLDQSGDEQDATRTKAHADDDDAAQANAQHHEHHEHHAALAALDTQHLSFSSASHNLSSPRLRMPRLQALHPSSSSCPLPSQVGDSYPMPSLDLVHDPVHDLVDTTSTAVLEHYLCSQTCLSPKTPMPPQDPAAHDRPTAALDSLPTRPLHHAVIPVTPISLPPLARKRKTPPDQQDTSVFDVTHISSSSLASSTPCSPRRADPVPPSEPMPDCNLPGSAAFELAAFCHPAGRDSHAIVPPSPPPGITHIYPQDLIPDELAKMTDYLSPRFRPVFLRPLTDPLERGYWLINCSLWPRQARHAAWTFLDKYLSSGLAGWGVWCRRRSPRASATNCTTKNTYDDDDDDNDDDYNDYNDDYNDYNDDNDDWIRLYCWACVVKHMYLLLYIASERRLKTIHAAWIDANGETVLEVLPSDCRA
ncbi:hypothetical protein CDD82_6827 [Ophiocordyceps australis]|uniref:Uncharacterized protein n=1 Tax=Ophiocordyceps australis TaxID=1399860 RepID=A0A2C5YTI6_9HYPO|nr:hypothetical protein CDD82_6827 [Ophiocordyceps australis]